MFFRERDSAGSALVRADTGTRGEVLKITRIVDDNAQNFHVRPSPDGAYIAFDSDREGTRAVFVADADGHNVHRVSGEGFAAVPSWSPDGSQLAFVKGEENDSQVWNLWTTRPPDREAPAPHVLHRRPALGRLVVPGRHPNRV